MRKSRLTVLVVVLAGALGWLLSPSGHEVQADPTKTKPCGSGTCLANEKCCIIDPCSAEPTCLPSRIGKCPPPLPCYPGTTAIQDATPNAVCE
jgi:hypothetical protein